MLIERTERDARLKHIRANKMQYTDNRKYIVATVYVYGIESNVSERALTSSFTSHAGKSAAVTVVKITRVEGMANSWALVTYRDAASVNYSIGGWGRFWY